MNNNGMGYVIAFVIIAILLLAASGCEQPQQILPLPQSCQIVLQVFTITDGACQQCEDDKPRISAIQASGYCQVEIIDANDPRAAGIRNFPEYRVWVNGSLYYRTNNIKDLYRLIP